MSGDVIPSETFALVLDILIRQLTDAIRREEQARERADFVIAGEREAVHNLILNRFPGLRARVERATSPASVEALLEAVTNLERMVSQRDEKLESLHQKAGRLFAKLTGADRDGEDADDLLDALLNRRDK